MSTANWKYTSEPSPLVKADYPGLTEGYTMAWFGPEVSTLEDRWESAEGIFLFLKGGKDILENRKAVLADRLLEYLRDPLFAQVRFLWIENPMEPIQLWRSNAIPVEGNQVSRKTFLDMHNYACCIPKGTLVESQSDKFLFSLPAGSQEDDLYFSTNNGLNRLPDIVPIDGQSHILELKMGGDQRGCICFDIDIPMALDKKNLSFVYPGFTHLDISLRMFFRDPDFPEVGDTFYLASNRYPVFDESHPLFEKQTAQNISRTPNAGHPLKAEIEALLITVNTPPQKADPTEDKKYSIHEAFNYYPEKNSFSVCLDLLYPLSRERSYFEFKPSTKPASQNHGIPSSYRTNRGYTIHFNPIVPSSRLVFSPKPASRNEEDMAQAPYYLVPSGTFDCEIISYRSGEKEYGNAICGVSGLEYLKVSDDTAFTFVPDQPAFAPSYISVQSLLRDLTIILESYSSRTLPPDETDLDMLIEEKEVGEDNRAMGITDIERMEILEIIRKDYFPPNFSFTPKEIAAYQRLEIVEELVAWLQATLQSVPPPGDKGQKVFEAYPDTAWVHVEEIEDGKVENKKGAVYYAQPDLAVLYEAEDSSKEFLDYMEVPAVWLPPGLDESAKTELLAETGNSVLAYPMLPYGNVDPHHLTDLMQLEILLINNYRRNRIQKISEITDTATAPVQQDPEANHIGTTPQGLIATFSESYKTINSLQLAKDTRDQPIQLANIEQNSALKASLQSNQLFMVMTDPRAISSYEVFNEFYLSNAFPSGRKNVMDIQEWIFELGSDHWAKKDTILVFKFHNKPLLEMAARPELWSMPEAFNGDMKKAGDASKKLVSLLKNAVEIGKSSDVKERRKYELLARAATQANWMGIIAFNVDVPLRNLPDALKSLAGGMDAEKFYSQYIGVEVTPVKSTGKALDPQQSSLFGLIDYSNPEIPTTPKDQDYNFHVPSLTVVFQNSQIVAFAAEVLIVMDKLFGESTKLKDSKTGFNVLSLKGVAEEHDGEITYSFGFHGENIYQLSGKVVQELEIVKAQFATDPIKDPTAASLDITGRFVFWGRMRFAYNNKFDILSFGATPGLEEAPGRDYLNLSNLQVTMNFKLVTDANGSTSVKDKGFTFRPDQLAFDLDRSGWRASSLYEKFPLKFTGFKYVKGDDQALSKSGFMPVKSPLQAAKLADNWYGLTYDLNLGSVGALAGGAGMVVSILAAWVPNEKGVFVGLKLPGSSGGKKEISIQGLLKISFKSIQFVVYPTTVNEDPLQLNNKTEREVGYLLKLKNIVLKFLTLSFPPSGQTEIILFGDSREEVARKDKLLGWYASYAKK